MEIQYDEKGKFFTELVPKIPVHAVVQTTGQLIRGNIHVREGERLKDELDRDELFLAMTEARVIGADGQVQYQVPFLAVKRAQVIWVLPDEGEPKPKS